MLDRVVLEWDLASQKLGEAPARVERLENAFREVDVDTDQDGMITVSDRKHHRILAADATGIKQHNMG